MRKKMLPVAVLASCAALAGSGKTVPISKTAKLFISGQCNVRVTGESRGDLSWEIDSAKAAVRVSSTPHMMKLWVVGLDASGTATLDVRVPRMHAVVIVELPQGDIEANGLDGELAAKTGAGRIKLDRVKSAVVKSGGGEIGVGHVAGLLKCFLGAGPIHVDSAGEAHFESNGGEISLRESSGPVYARTAGGNIRIGRVGGGVEASTGGGIIDIGSAAGPVVATTGSGSIQVSGAKGVKCKSGDGAIRLRGVTGSLDAATSSGTILAELPEDWSLKPSVLKTGRGDVIVLIPSKLVVTVDAVSTSGGRPARIDSEFPEILVRPGVVEGMRVVHAVGSINGGGPVLKVEAAGGTIFLRKQK